MDAAALIADARRWAGLTQAQLAARAATSQATLSAYESGRKDPAAATLLRLLAAAGATLETRPLPAPVRALSHGEAERRGRILEQVIALAEALPSRPARELTVPPIARIAADAHGTR